MSNAFFHRNTHGPGVGVQIFHEGDIGGSGSDEGTAGGDSGNYGEDGSGTGGSSRSSDRFNSGGGSSDPVRTVETTIDAGDSLGEQRGAFRGTVGEVGGPVAEISPEADVNVGGGGVENRMRTGRDDVAVEEVVSGVRDTVSPVTDAVGETVSFVRSGPDEASVGSGDFGDGVVAGGNETTVERTRTTPQNDTSGVDQGFIDNQTDSGGLVSETANSSDGLLPGEIAGIDVSEQRLENIADRGAAVAEKADDFEPEPASPDAAVGNFAFGTNIAGEAADAFGGAAAGGAALPRATESGVEFAQNAPLNLETARTAGTVGVETARSQAKLAVNEPVEFATGAGLSYVTGAAAGRVAGSAARRGRSASTRIGGEYIEPTDLTNEQTVRFYESGDAGADARFPGAVDDDLYQTDPAAAVRQQADEFTPDRLESLFGEAGVDDATDLKKAIEVNPEGPEVGRGNTGLATQEGSYESPGSFAGPELSPNFLGLNEGRSFSLRPGLPDTGSNPTGVVVRTEVRNADSSTLDEFNRELLDAEGDTTARTKPASEANPGEAEAVIPPEAEFAPVRSGGIFSGVRNRLGIGSDFYTRIDGQNVELQPVADPDLIDSRGSRSFLGENRGQAPAGRDAPSATVGDTRQLSEFRRVGDAGTDRPLPTPLPGAEFGADPGGFGGETTIQRDETTSSRVDDAEPSRSTPSSQPAEAGAVDLGAFGSFGAGGSTSPSRTTSPGRDIRSPPPDDNRTSSPTVSDVFGVGVGSSTPTSDPRSQAGGSPTSGRPSPVGRGSSPVSPSGSGFGSSGFGGSSGGRGAGGGGPGGGGGGGGGGPPSSPNQPANRPEREIDEDRDEREGVFGLLPTTPLKFNPVVDGAAAVFGFDGFD